MMMTGKLSLFWALVLLALAHDASSQSEEPPMYAVHDFASGKLQERRTIKNTGHCDTDFGSELESIVNEMEQSREASEEVATRLKTQFMELMDKNPNKFLCVSESWCDMGVCKKRQEAARFGRGFDAESSGASTQDSGHTGPTSEKLSGSSSGEPGATDPTKSTPTPSGGVPSAPLSPILVGVLSIMAAITYQ